MANKLKPGDKYLTIELIGHNKVHAFKNEDRTEENNQPHYRGNGVSVYINKKKAEQDKIPEEDI